VIDDGSGTADGAEPSSSTGVDDAGNLSSGALIDDGLGTSKGKKSSPPVDRDADRVMALV